jgi:hypothetical protein
MGSLDTKDHMLTKEYPFQQTDPVQKKIHSPFKSKKQQDECEQQQQQHKLLEYQTK